LDYRSHKRELEEYQQESLLLKGNTLLTMDYLKKTWYNEQQTYLIGIW
jgi:hypothetical protein